VNCKFVIPTICPDLIDNCLLHYDLDPGDLTLVDNSQESHCKKHEERGFRICYHPHNLGVAASWNEGARALREDEMLWIVGSSLVFPRGFSVLLEAAKLANEWGVYTPLRWHAIGITKKAFDVIGLFDENFYPAYMEDLDWLQRRDNLGKEGRKVIGYTYAEPEAVCTVQSAALVRRLIPGNPWSADYPNRIYYAEKWGSADTNLNAYMTPFDGKEPRQIPPRSHCIPGICTPRTGMA
jgi:GT2 family glycosyltransferase